MTTSDDIQEAQRPPEVRVTPLDRDGLGTPRRTLAAKAEAAGFDIDVYGWIGYDAPRWQKRHPDDERTAYFGKLIYGVGIVGIRRRKDGPGLVGFTATWTWVAGSASGRAPSVQVKFKDWHSRGSTITELNAELARLQ